MTRNGSCRTIRWISIDGMLASFAKEKTTVRFNVPDEVGSFHNVSEVSGCSQDQCFSSNFPAAGKVFFKFFTIRIENQFDRFRKVFAHFLESLALSVGAWEFGNITNIATFLRFFENRC